MRTREQQRNGTAAADYATPHDFCVLFYEEMSALYSLALLLTADHQRAEAAFAAALSDCQSTTAVFREWMPSWSRRAVVKSAALLMRPAPGNEGGGSEAVAQVMAPGIRRVLRLSTFERFVFAMTVLEKQSDRESAALLGVSARQVEQARSRALRLLAGNDDGRATGSGLLTALLPVAGAA